MITSTVKIRNYEAKDQVYFERYNREWIEKYFWMEPIDIQVLQHPQQYIIQPGGKILSACIDEKIIGVAALKFVDRGVYEFTKMAVAEEFRGKGFGEALVKASIEKAKELGAVKVILYSNTKLVSAISLYRKLGFQEVTLDGVYERSDIKMELLLHNEF